MTLLGKLPHGAMTETLRSHAILVCPSMRDEGLPLTMAEAILAGCAVITTCAGGVAVDRLEDRFNSLRDRMPRTPRESVHA